MTQCFSVKGMECAHCAKVVEDAVRAVPGVEDVMVDVDRGNVTISGNADPEQLRMAIESAGYDVSAP